MNVVRISLREMDSFVPLGNEKRHQPGLRRRIGHEVQIGRHPRQPIGMQAGRADDRPGKSPGREESLDLLQDPLEIQAVAPWPRLARAYVVGLSPAAKPRLAQRRNGYSVVRSA